MTATSTCTHGHAPNSCDAAGCPHNREWVLHGNTPLDLLKASVREWANAPHPLVPMGAESTPERRLFHQVGAPERRAGSLDIPSIEKRARLAVLRGDADRDGVRALGRDILLLIEALRETSWPH